MALSVVWGVYAVVWLAIGFWKKIWEFRIAALGLLAVVAIKVVLVDMATVKQIYRIISFVVLGLMMISASYLYHRLEQTPYRYIRRRLMNRFVLTICSLSMLSSDLPDRSGGKSSRSLQMVLHGTTERPDNRDKRRGVEFALPPKVIDLSLPHLDDLRLVLGADEELGYKIRVSKGKSQKKKLDTKLFNRSYLPGRQSSITADFGGKFLKNRIKVVTNGTNFFRKVRIEGSDDQNDWKIIREGCLSIQDRGRRKAEVRQGNGQFPGQ